jgi:hypothetical protein
MKVQPWNLSQIRLFSVAKESLFLRVSQGAECSTFNTYTGSIPLPAIAESTPDRVHHTTLFRKLKRQCKLSRSLWTSPIVEKVSRFRIHNFELVLPFAKKALVFHTGATQLAQLLNTVSSHPTPGSGTV